MNVLTAQRVLTDGSAQLHERLSSSRTVPNVSFQQDSNVDFLILIAQRANELALKPVTFRFIQGNQSTVKVGSRLKNEAL